MKTKLVMIAIVLAFVSSLAAPALALAAKPIKTEFTAIVIPGVVIVTDEKDLGESGQVIAKEYIGGFIPFSS